MLSRQACSREEDSEDSQWQCQERFDLCRILAAALRGSRDFSLELDQAMRASKSPQERVVSKFRTALCQAWGVAQQQGDYSPVAPATEMCRHVGMNPKTL